MSAKMFRPFCVCGLHSRSQTESVFKYVSRRSERLFSPTNRDMSTEFGISHQIPAVSWQSWMAAGVVRYLDKR